MAAKDQDMTIARTMRLKEDLKVHADYDKSNIYNRLLRNKNSLLMPIMK